MSGKELHKIFRVIHPNIYYSIYSVDPKFRKKWLRNALPVEEALGMLQDWQDRSKKIVKLHWSFIKDENDSITDVVNLSNAVTKSGLRVDINLVRYNPYSEKYGSETDECIIYRNHSVLSSFFPESKIRIIDRVGFDVKASCGMFINA